MNPTLPRGRRIPAALLLVFALVAAAVIAGRAQAPVAPPMSPAQRAAWERLWASLPRVPVPASASGAAVVIVKFTDFQCGACAWTHVQYKPVIAKYQARYPGQVLLVTKDYPLQSDCNRHEPRSLHTAACDAAIAVRLAPPSTRAALEDWFYLNQIQLSPATVRRVAASIGKVTDFEKGRAAVQPGIDADTALAARLGVRSTPTFFINGARLPTAPTMATPEQLDIVIAYELRRAGR